MKINDHFRFLNIGLPEDILRRKMYGDFDGAIRLIDLFLAKDNITDALRSCLIVQKEIMLRAYLDYPYTKEEAINVVREHLPDFTEEEFDQRVDDGKIRWIYINGEERYFNRFFQSMVKADTAFAARVNLTLPGAESNVKKNEKMHIDRCIDIMKEKGSLAQRIKIRATMKVKDEIFEKGMFIRAHLPVASACEQQSDIVIEDYYPKNAVIDPEEAPQRTICWEMNLEENEEFFVEYSYIHKATFHDTEKFLAEGPDAYKGLVAEPLTEEEYADYTKEEAPHIVFSPYIKNLVETLTKDVTDPLEKARIFYDYVSLNMKYTFMPAYFNLENIAETCARTYTGDCGVFALLFITLCRCAGIPCCWQSGLTAEPGFCGGHDWTRFYAAPYGWMYADPSYGTAAVRTENEERRKFYFGNLDAYRMVANSEFQAPFLIDKDHWRADPYDNQVGEIETTDRGLNYSEYDRSKITVSIEEL